MCTEDTSADAQRLGPLPADLWTSHATRYSSADAKAMAYINLCGIHVVVFPKLSLLWGAPEWNGSVREPFDRSVLQSQNETMRLRENVSTIRALKYSTGTLQAY